MQQDKKALKILKQRSVERGTAGKLTVVSEDAPITHGIELSPSELHSNAALAIALCEVLLKQEDPGSVITPEITRVLQTARLPGNEICTEGQRTWVLSTAHNEMSITAATKWYRTLIKGPE